MVGIAHKSHNYYINNNSNIYKTNESNLTTMQWLQHYITDRSTTQDDVIPVIVTLALFLTLISPVTLRAKKVLIPLEAIAVILVLKAQSFRSAPATTPRFLDSPNQTKGGIVSVFMNVPLDNGELPPISQWTWEEEPIPSKKGWY